MKFSGALAAVIVATGLTVTGCSSMQLEDFEQRSPRLRLEEYFQGRTWAWGIFEDRFGNLRREFSVLIDGDWDGQMLVLDESFQYSDGETDHRLWVIEAMGDGTYRGSAHDVIGTAEGQVAGNALRWQYEMNLPVDGNTWKVRFDDWMFLQSDDVLINRARVSRWGFNIGTVTIFFSKRGPRA